MRGRDMWLYGLQWLSSWFCMTCEHIQSMSPSTPPPLGRWNSMVDPACQWSAPELGYHLFVVGDDSVNH